MKPTCSNCMFWRYFDECEDSETAWDEEGLGTCHRYPPSPSPDGAMPNERPYSPNKWQHPSTGEKDWCGEHKPDISDAIDAPTEPPKDAQ